MSEEDNIVAQIETVNDMLNIICKELNELETIDDYKIELINNKIMVTVKHNLEGGWSK